MRGKHAQIQLQLKTKKHTRYFTESTNCKHLPASSNQQLADSVKTSTNALGYRFRADCTNRTCPQVLINSSVSKSLPSKNCVATTTTE